MDLFDGFDSTREFAQRQLERKFTLPERTGRPAHEVIRSAEEGDAESQFLLGTMAEEGYGVPQDEEAAFSWFRKAARQGHAEAFLALFRMLDTGYSPGTQDNGLIPLEGFIEQQSELLSIQKWSCLRKAAKKGLAEAQYRYGIRSSGDNPDRKDFLGRAARQGHPKAQMQLNQEAQDRELWKKAIHWLRKAASTGVPEAQRELGSFHLSGHRVKEDLQKGLDWFRQAAEQGDGLCQAELGIRFLYGQGVAKNPEIARGYLRSAASQGHWPAAFLLKEVLGEAASAQEEVPPLLPVGRLTNPEKLRFLGYSFLHGSDVPQNDGLAIKAFEIASAAGAEGASFDLGCLYLEGRGVPLDPEKALSFFSLEEAQKSWMKRQFSSRAAVKILLDIRRENPDCPIPLKEASVWFNERAREGDPACQYVSAWMNYKSIGPCSGFEEIQRLLLESAEQGFLPAQAELWSVFWDLMPAETLNRHLEAVTKAAEAGDSHCRLALYPYGEWRLTPEEIVKIERCKWLPLAAESGEPRAWNNLAGIRLHGFLGFERSIDAAIGWLRKLVELGDAPAFVKLGCALLQRFENRATKWSMGSYFERIAPLVGNPTLPMSEEEKAEIFNPVGEEARIAFEEAYRRGFAEASYWLGEMYRTGLGIPRDPAKAAFWYERAIKTHPDRVKLGFLYLRGDGVDKDEAKAARLFLEDEFEESKYLLGRMFLEGRGVIHSPLAAARLFRSISYEDLQSPGAREYRPDACAAASLAAEALANLYREGIGVKQDDGWAEYWERVSRGEFNEKD